MATRNYTEDAVLVEDIEARFGEVSRAFGQLQALFRVIAGESDQYSTTRKVAEIGVFMSGEYENVSDLWTEEVQKDGVRMSFQGEGA